MREFDFTLRGSTPLLFHADDVEQADRLEEWRKDPANKNVSKPGDDRSPPWTWQTYLYSHQGKITWPSINVMVGLRAAGAQLILKKQKTYKEISQSGMMIVGEHCRFLVNGKELSTDPIVAMRDLPFREQSEAVKALGFSLFVKRARVGSSKHVRVRARFEGGTWTVAGRMRVSLPEITEEVLRKLFDLAGFVGQGDWRPGCRTPGAFGQFESQLRSVSSKAA